MPRPRKPTVLHALSGAMAHNPKRFTDRKNEPKPEIGIGDAPKWMARLAKAVWRDLQADIAPGVLTQQDRQAFAVLCCLVDQFRRSPGAMQTSRIAQMNSLLGQFGMSPSTRSKVSVKPPPLGENPFAQFIRPRPS